MKVRRGEGGRNKEGRKGRKEGGGERMEFFWEIADTVVSHYLIFLEVRNTELKLDSSNSQLLKG